jgi:iron(III)-enterobactin esterase
MLMTGRIKTFLFAWFNLLLAGFLAGCNLALPAPLMPTVNATMNPARTRTTQPPTAAPTQAPSPQPTATLVPTPTAVPSITATPYPPVNLEKFQLTSRFMNGIERTISVYLPGEYAQNPDRRYKVLYAFDGQELPMIAFEQYLNSLFSSHQVEPVLVVAVDALTGDLRHEELGAGPYLNVFGWGTLSDAFNKFMVNELIPKIDGKYRTRAGARNTGIMGWSLGGLSAFYLAWQYPDRFGTVGAFSPSFWWRMESKAGGELQARVIHKVVLNSAKRPDLRMWFEAGTLEEPITDIDKNGVPDVIQDVQDLWKILEAKGYRDGVDMQYIEVAGGAHHITTWAKVLPDFLRFAFPY